MAGAQKEGKAGFVLTFCGGSSVRDLGKSRSDKYNIGEPMIPSSVKGERYEWMVAGASAHHSVGKAIQGGLYSWGRNEYGQCGQGRGNFDTCEELGPVQGLEGINIVGVACGAHHTCGHDDKGNLYVCGDRRKGQLGLGKQQMLSVKNDDWSCPMRVPGLEGKVVQVAAGQDTTLVLMESGEVWATGCMEYGMTGRSGNEANSKVVYVNGISCQPVFLPVPALEDKKIVAIAVGAHHAVALDDAYTLWTWGMCGQGRRGRGDNPGTKSFQVNPTSIPFDNITSNTSRRVHVPLGGSLALSFYSTNVVTVHGVPGSEAQAETVRGCGDKDSKKMKPAAPPLKTARGDSYVGRVHSIACGFDSLLVAGDRSCWSMGHATNEELGRTYQDSMGRKTPIYDYNPKDIKPIPKLEGIHVAQVAAGRGFSWFLMDPAKSEEGKIEKLGTFKFPVSNQDKDWKPKKNVTAQSPARGDAAVTSPGKSVGTSTGNVEDQPLAKRLGNKKSKTGPGPTATKRKAASGAEPAKKKVKK